MPPSGDLSMPKPTPAFHAPPLAPFGDHAGQFQSSHECPPSACVEQILSGGQGSDGRYMCTRATLSSGGGGVNQALILAVGNLKGAVGKTTLAINLAIWPALRGNDVLLVDEDEQGTARTFTKLRPEIFGAPKSYHSTKGLSQRSSEGSFRSRMPTVGSKGNQRVYTSRHSSFRRCWRYRLHILCHRQGSSTNDRDERQTREKFIRAAPQAASEADGDVRFIQTPIRFPRESIGRPRSGD